MDEMNDSRGLQLVLGRHACMTATVPHADLAMSSHLPLATTESSHLPNYNRRQPYRTGA